MAIEYLFFTLYLVISIWLIPKINFIKNAGLNTTHTRLLLAFKMITGVACAYYFSHLSTNLDYLAYNAEGKIQYELLLSEPGRYFSDITNDINKYGLDGLFAAQESFWAYLRFNLLYKFIAILNLVTHGNFYLNSIIFSSLVFFGHIAFYRIYNEIYRGHSIKTLIACFCLPSLLLYTSCIHKDGLVFLSLGLTSYIFYRVSTSQQAIKFRFSGIFLFGIATIFLFRNYVVVAMIPAMLIALLCNWLPYKKRFILSAIYSFYFLTFFLTGLVSSSFNLPAAVVQRKADFAALGAANTNISMNELEPTVLSFIQNLPQAINHYLFRPYLWEFPQFSVLLTAVELFFYQIIILTGIFYRKKGGLAVHPFNIFGLALVINMMLIIGYTIPNIGAIVRYRSIFWVFIICPLLCNTDWNRIFRPIINLTR